MSDNPAIDLTQASLEDKYALREGLVFMTGLQALVRVPLEQRARDEAAGLRTAGFISGYRGSPLGRYDLELWRAKSRLKERGIHFQPGINEDLAATAVWGSQFVGSFPGAKVDGVFGIWYGKGPGLDRSGDPLRHGNLAGSSAQGGALILVGDDHTAKSSTTAHQSDYQLMGFGTPVLYPANVQEIYEFGLHGLAMSRHCGCWVALKLVTDIVESAGSVLVGADYPRVRIPVRQSEESPHIRVLDPAAAREARLLHVKLPEALAYARTNLLNRIEQYGKCTPRLGLITAGKSYADTRQAMLRLGVSTDGPVALRLLKLGMVWPLDPAVVCEFAEGLDAILVVEEKRPVIEHQLKTILYDSALEKKPRIVGKYDHANEWSPDRGAPVLPATFELTPDLIAPVLARFAGIESAGKITAAAKPAGIAPMRSPHFCSGCPHGTSTNLPEGSRALAGIGCHGMATQRRPQTTFTMSHMGGEGGLWFGQAPFTDEKHIFANMGDGTYFHSGFLAIRQALAAGVNMTYKLLVNGFVSMTGGQPIEGTLSVPQLVQELLAEGVRRIVVVTDEVKKYDSVTLPANIPVRDRSELDRTQCELREEPGVSILIYEQQCATERRRMRKRGAAFDPPKRTFINAAVCEGCGDCSTVSGCLAVEPQETELGRKRRINQSSCNKDFSCVEGFCPSFVTVHGGNLRARAGAATRERASPPELPQPQLPALAQPFAMLVTGIGGAGVITIGAVVTQAAHLDGKAASALDVTGLAQKYGAVMSHVRIATMPEALHSPRLASGDADLLIGSDLLVAASDEALSLLRRDRTHAIVNADLVPTGEFTMNPDWNADPAMLQERIAAASATAVHIDAARVATALLGDAIAANMFLLGFSWQQGRLPLRLAAILRAIELNGVAVKMNQEAFAWGRAYAADAQSVERLIAPTNVIRFVPRKQQDIEELVAHRSQLLSDYQSADYAQRYQRKIDSIRKLEESAGGNGQLAKAVARYYYKLLAHKDEFEVARLYAHPDFQAQLDQTFEGGYQLRFHLAGGPFGRVNAGRVNAATGKPAKTELGPWMMRAFRVLAALRFLRGSVFDPFRHSAERKLGVELLAQYEADLSLIEGKLQQDNYTVATALATWPEQVRGYGHVRAAHAQRARLEREKRLAQFSAGPMKIAVNT